MTLVPNDQTLRTTVRLQTMSLLDQLTVLSAAVQDVRKEQCQLRDHQSALATQLQALSLQQILFAEESFLRQEEKAIFAQLSYLQRQGEPSPR